MWSMSGVPRLITHWLAANTADVPTSAPFRAKLARTRRLPFIYASSFCSLLVSAEGKQMPPLRRVMQDQMRDQRERDQTQIAKGISRNLT